MSAESVRFSAAARVISAEARKMGLRTPAFRSPPRIAGAIRTIRRAHDGDMVAIVVRGRPLTDVVADLIEGVVVANGLAGSRAVRCRRRLAEAFASSCRHAA